MTQHTQGPWDLQGTLISHGEGRPIARVWNEHENWESNARVMAAAPELLEACELAFMNLSPAYSADHLVMKTLIAAIAKARGQS